MKSLCLAVVATTLALPALAQEKMEVIPMRYLCDRGVEVPATYVNSHDDASAVINVEGQQISLIVEKSASGARYGWPSDGSHYVWWTKGPEATLYWHNGETGEETVLLGGCKQEE
ncbi:MAG: MliC family protein [Paracoccaceae bacterium]